MSAKPSPERSSRITSNTMSSSQNPSTVHQDSTTVMLTIQADGHLKEKEREREREREREEEKEEKEKRGSG